MNTYELIKNAIKNKQQIIAEYDGYIRHMCPHVIGKKDGKKQALFYQFGGGSRRGLSSDPTRNWRCIPIDGLKNIQVLQGDWHTAKNHSRCQTCVDEIDSEVKYSE